MERLRSCRLGDLPEVAVAADVESAIGNGGGTENCFFQGTAFQEHRVLVRRLDDVGDALFVDTIEQPAGHNDRRAERAFQAQLARYLARPGIAGDQDRAAESVDAVADNDRARSPRIQL